MRWILIIALMLGTMAQPSHTTAYAQATPVGNKPLVVIRFNQRSVYYERQLFTALERAVAVKPSVLFEVVSYVPIGRDELANADLNARGQANLNRVLASFAEMGVPRDRVNVLQQSDGGLKYQEVHVFVY